ncbi:MAG: hemoglobin/transferrin/lactoferrin receptor protein [Planctomycetota bacterium]|jgi:hemoglobin/transferrin/lactoferrin receptor protein
MKHLIAIVTVVSCAPLLLAQATKTAPKTAPQTAAGQDSKKPQQVVVTASGFRENELRSPYTFQSLDQFDLLHTGSRTLPEALRYTPGVMIQKTAHGHGSPFIRGFTGRRNLMMIDGIRLNNSTFRSGPIQYWNTIDSLSIDRLEVVKSQGSVLYGSDAIGGTVNVFTKSSDFRGESHGSAFHHGNAIYRFDTNSLSHTGRLEVTTGEGGAWGLHLGATYRDYGDIRDSEVGRMPKTGYQEFDYDLRLDVALANTATLTVAHQSVKQDDVWRSHRTGFFEPWHGTSLGSPDIARVYDQERTLSYLRVADQNRVGAVSGYSLTFSFQQADEDFQRTRRSGVNTRMELDRTEVDTFGAALGLESQFGGGTLVYGVDYYRDSVNSSRRDLRTDPLGNVVSDTFNVQGPVGDDATYDLLGLYLQHRLPVNNAFEVTTGGRYTYAAADIGVLDDGAGHPISADRSWDKATFQLRGTYRIDEHISIYGGASQAFRAPNVADLSSLKSSRTDQIATGSLNVDSEDYITYELGSRFRSDDVSLNASVFYIDMDGAITSRPIGTVPATGEVINASTNGANGYLWGGELEGAWRLTESLTTSGFIAYVDGEADTFPSNSLTPVREPVSRLMPFTSSLALRWQMPHSRWWLATRVTAVARGGRLSSSDRSDTSRIPPSGTPGYLHVMINGGYQATEQLELFVTLDNVTDIDYRVHGSGVNEPGINAIVGGQWSW